jgi:uncharacterized membrane protein YhaH (DUF805 family)
MHWMIEPFRRYADFRGRSRRTEYWMFFLLNMIVYFVFIAIMLAGMPWGEITASSSQAAMDGSGAIKDSYNAGYAAGSSASTQTPPGPLFYIGIGGLLLWVLATFIPNIAVAVRRFHDQDKSGWMYLLSLIPYVGGIILIVFMCLEGTRGPNQYGNDPKNPGLGGTDIFA